MLLYKRTAMEEMAHIERILFLRGEVDLAASLVEKITDPEKMLAKAASGR